MIIEIGFSSLIIEMGFSELKNMRIMLRVWHFSVSRGNASMNGQNKAIGVKQLLPEMRFHYLRIIGQCYFRFCNFGMP